MGGRTALVVDDNVLTRLDLRRIVESAGYSVSAEAGDGQSAVALALERGPNLIVMDVDMPCIDGLEAARRILSMRWVPIVLLTGFAYGELVSRAVDLGVPAYVTKPFREGDLLDAMAAAVEAREGEGGACYVNLGRRSMPF